VSNTPRTTALLSLNLQSTIIYFSNPIVAFVILFSDETSWDIVDSNGVTVETGSNLDDTTTYTENFCLPKSGRYRANIYDSSSDGCVASCVLSGSRPPSSLNFPAFSVDEIKLSFLTVLLPFCVGCVVAETLDTQCPLTVPSFGMTVTEV
jgi:hypothetical protein